MSWSAAQYGQFEEQRNRPIHDLLAHIPMGAAASAVDIGCGPGNSTELLKARFPGAVVTGLDNAPDMLAAARLRLPDVPFVAADIGAWDGAGPFDVILANAALQWVPDHARLFPALMDKLAPGGRLAVQMPDNMAEPAHRLMARIAAEGPWAETLAQARQSRTALLDADWYYRLLMDHASAVDIWRTTYHHPLAGGASAVVEWFKGTGLRPFLDPLSEAERAAFLALYRAAVEKAYPALPDGTVLLPFPRLFIIAVR
jgi:trans-aconitate 2-methyltransferase